MTPNAARTMLPRIADRIDATKAKLDELYVQRREAFVALTEAGDLQQDIADLARVTPGLVGQQLVKARSVVSSNGKP